MPKLFSVVEMRRDQVLRLRTTTPERELISQKAADCGMSLSEYMLRSALGKPVRGKVAATIINELSRLNAELKLQRENMEHIDGYATILVEIADAIELIPADARQMEDF